MHSRQMDPFSHGRFHHPEMSTFLMGKAIFHPEEGEPIIIDAGDTLYFDANSKGTWEVIETVRKAYLTYKNDETD